MGVGAILARKSLSAAPSSAAPGASSRAGVSLGGAPAGAGAGKDGALAALGGAPPPVKAKAVEAVKSGPRKWGKPVPVAAGDYWIRVQGLGFGGWGSGFRVLGLGFGGWGLDHRVRIGGTTARTDLQTKYDCSPLLSEEGKGRNVLRTCTETPRPESVFYVPDSLGSGHTIALHGKQSWSAEE